MTDLVLVGGSESRGGGHWSCDDYDVRLGDANGRVVGKIFKGGNGTRWSQLALDDNRANAAEAHRSRLTREEAMEAFERAWASADETSG